MKKKYIWVTVFIMISVFVLIQCATAGTTISSTNGSTSATTASSGSSSGSSTEDGATLVAQRCTPCHFEQRAVSERQSKDGWTRTVADMIKKGTD